MLNDDEIAAAKQVIDEVIGDYSSHTRLLEAFLAGLVGSTSDEQLSKYIHSVRSRRKDPDHLRDKLNRKLDAAEDSSMFPYTIDNYFTKINDLVGMRILHLHTHQIRQIDPHLKRVLHEYNYVLIEGPIARTWDLETTKFFEDCGIACSNSESLYTSIHYVVQANLRTPYTAEIQVRTLSEEVWGETNHTINYPHATGSLPCREQLKALARVTSSATRLVDSIFASHDDYLNGHPPA